MGLIQEPVSGDLLDSALVPDAESRVGQIMASVREQRTREQRCDALDELLELHNHLETAKDIEEERQQTIRNAEIAFLLLLRDDPEILENPKYRRFVAQCVNRDTFYSIEWHNSDEVIRVAEVLYGFRYHDELTPDQLTGQVRDLVRHALRQFEREDKAEEMFALLQRAPIPDAMMDAELVRLRNRLHLYEAQRVRRKRRWLYGYMIAQAVVVLLIFPLLFQNVENGQIQRQVEATTGLEIVEGRVQCTQTNEDTECEVGPEYQFLTLGDSLYWSVITYGAIGYGDISPITDIGKVLAGIHGLMGVLTTGIIAGLVLNWISPRSLRP